MSISKEAQKGADDQLSAPNKDAIVLFVWEKNLKCYGKNKRRQQQQLMCLKCLAVAVLVPLHPWLYRGTVMWIVLYEKAANKLEIMYYYLDQIISLHYFFNDNTVC
jgi:hypothetical protein